jgi:hypothetical protein
MAQTSRTRSIGLAVAAGAMIPLATAGPSWSAPPISGSGAGQVTGDEVTSTRFSGQNRIVERDITGFLTGALEGSFTEHVVGVVHPDGTVTFGGTLSLTGTVEGCGTGTVTGRLQGRGQASPPVTDAVAAVTGLSGSTVGLSGHGTVHQEGASLSYSFQYSCR